MTAILQLITHLYLIAKAIDGLVEFIETQFPAGENPEGEKKP